MCIYDNIIRNLRRRIRNLESLDIQNFAKLWSGTQENYDLIDTKDANTIYIILPSS